MPQDNSFLFEIKDSLNKDISQLFMPIISKLEHFNKLSKEAKHIDMDKLDEYIQLSEILIQLSYPFFAYYTFLIIKENQRRNGGGNGEERYSIIPTYDSQDLGRIISDKLLGRNTFNFDKSNVDSFRKGFLAHIKLLIPQLKSRSKNISGALKKISNEKNGILKHAWADFLSDDLFLNLYVEKQKEKQKEMETSKKKGKRLKFSTSYYFSHVTSRLKFIIFNKSGTKIDYTNGLNIETLEENHIRETLLKEEVDAFNTGSTFSPKKSDTISSIKKMDISEYSDFLNLYLDYENAKTQLEEKLSKVKEPDSVMAAIIKRLNENYDDKGLYSFNEIKVQTNISWADPLSKISHGMLTILSDHLIEEKILEEVHLLTYPLILKIAEIEHLLRRLKDSVKIRENNLKTAIVSILVDSFAHNISAHSLSSIIWLFMKRKNILENRFENHALSKVMERACIGTENSSDVLVDIIPESEIKKISEEAGEDYSRLGWKRTNYDADFFSLCDLLAHIDEEYLSRLFTFKELPVDTVPNSPTETPRFPIPLDYEIFYFLKYLSGKSSFWNGVARDATYGGEANNWYEVIFEFALNPLFLGTISHTEGYNRILIKVEIFSESDTKAPVKGEFLEIDIDDLMKADKTSSKTFKNKHVIFPKDFASLKKELSKYNIFLPGGVIGQHALYTIFENTLRNIKHSKKIKNGDKIIFNIVVQPLDSRIYSITIWLSNETQVTEKDVSTLEKSFEDSIITKRGKPKLGGNSQDRICAAMLFTNKFSEVENRRLRYERKPLLPWINFPGLAPGVDIVKRSFKIWRGDIYLKIKNTDRLKDENPARFMFSLFEPNPKISKGKISGYGLIRILNTTELRPSQITEKEQDIFNLIRQSSNSSRIANEKDKLAVKKVLYKIWNSKWIKHDTGKILIGVCDDRGCETFFRVLNKNNEWIIERHDDNDGSQQVNFAHGECLGSNTSENSHSDILQYRNHGPLIKKFLKLLKCEIIDENRDEFIETLLTRIVIIDNRIYDRVKEKKKLDLLKKNLFIDIYRETDVDLARLKSEIINQENRSNFFILHLTFIESFKGYSENNLDKFIKDFFKDQELNHNTKLIITTGRGRVLWRDSIENEEFVEHVILKPIDMLLAAIEDALIHKDDFMVKYNLLKILFGS